MKNNKKMLELLPFAIVILSLMGICFYLINSKNEIKKAYENLESKYETLNEKYDDKNERQASLELCLTIAKADRESLWKANCPNKETKCSLPRNTIDWIDSRYAKDVEVCKIKYQN